MALIDCPECGTATSTEATFCPQCGFPVNRLPSHMPVGPSSIPQIPYTVLDATRSIVTRVMFGGLLFASGVAFDAPPTILLALVAWGSAVPLYLKARKAHRLGPAGSVGGQIQQAMVEQLTAVRDETRQELAGIDENASRIAELEERLEFMERLLAQQRDRA